MDTGSWAYAMTAMRKQLSQKQRRMMEVFIVYSLISENPGALSLRDLSAKSRFTKPIGDRSTYPP
jgi:hypothetical protein